jgi:hypothetical protein
MSESVNWAAPLGFGVRSRTWRPTDPVWAPGEALHKVRHAINAHFDGKLDVWWMQDWKPWDRRPGRWAVMYWRDKAQEWSVVFYWETALGDFRNIDLDCITTFTNMLHEADCSKEGRGLKERRNASETAQESGKQKRVSENSKARMEYAKDHTDRDFGIKQTFDMGKGGRPRRRQVKPSDLVDTNHERWKKQVGSK